jgi:hypothetical protein
MSRLNRKPLAAKPVTTNGVSIKKKRLLIIVKVLRLNYYLIFPSKLTGKPGYALHITCLYPESFAQSLQWQVF